MNYFAPRFTEASGQNINKEIKISFIQNTKHGRFVLRRDTVSSNGLSRGLGYWGGGLLRGLT